MPKTLSKFYHPTPCGIMFHHFHKNNKDKYVKNSITSKEFEKILKHIGIQNIVSAETWAYKAINNDLNKNEVCITFDDALKSQYEIALPILRKYKIKCFWFIFSSIFFGKKDPNEIHKFFYTKYFKNFKLFFENFKREIKILKRGDLILKILEQKKTKNYMLELKIYSKEERIYKFLRDKILTKEEITKIFDKLFKKFQFDEQKIIKQLWISKKDLKKIINDNHVIGLHSYSHPSNIASKSYKNQLREYTKNFFDLKKIYKKEIISASYPFGSYNSNSIKILKKLNIKLCFSSLSNIKFKHMAIPRIDHAKILKKI
jgi:peptidoglycan/xylan/chitin deacetylase (PgdA/CDA1 family)